jgi:tetratricopeptide (TPR) repeat protein
MCMGIVTYTRAIELEPGDPGTYNNRGVVFRELEDYERAIADFSHALTIRPDYDLAYLNRGRAYVDAGQTELAIADFRQVLQITEKSSRREDAEEGLRALGVEP